MAVLCIDTATDALVVALVGGLEGDPRVLASVVRGDVRAQGLLQLVEEALAAAQVRRADLRLVVVGTGPGGFTGIRIGVAAARGIAIELGLPLVGVPTAAAIAAPALLAGAGAPDLVVATIDAKRGERFQQAVRRGAAGDGDGDDDASHPAVVLEGALVAVAVCDADLVAVDGPPTAAGLALAARGRPALDPRAVLPTYGREPDARPRPTLATGGAQVGAAGADR